MYQKTIKTLLAKLKQQDVTMRDEEEELSRQVEYSHDLTDRMREIQDELDSRTEEADNLHVRFLFPSLRVSVADDRLDSHQGAVAAGSQRGWRVSVVEGAQEKAEGRERSESRRAQRYGQTTPRFTLRFTLFFRLIGGGDVGAGSARLTSPQS